MTHSPNLTPATRADAEAAAAPASAGTRAAAPPGVGGRFGRMVAMVAALALTISSFALQGTAAAFADEVTPPSSQAEPTPTTPQPTTSVEPSASPAPETDSSPATTTPEPSPSTSPAKRTGVTAQAASQSSSISGAVTGPKGEPIDGVEVSAYRWDQENEYFDWVASTRTMDNGSYVISGLSAGTYTLRFTPDRTGPSYVGEWWNDKPDEDSATTFKVGSSGTVTGKNAQLAVGATIAGVVTAPDGTPLSSVGVSALRWEDDWEGFDEVTSAETDDNGTYRLAGLTAGTYTLRFDPSVGGANFVSEWWDNKPDEESATTFKVSTGGTITGKNAELAVGGTIEGSVTSAKGEPISGVDVVPYRWDAQTGEYQSVGGDAATDEDGVFHSTGLPAGSYTLQFNAEDGKYASEWWQDTYYSTAADPFDVVAGGEPVQANAKLAKGAKISGTITGSTGKPVSGATVEAFLLIGSETVNVGYAETDDDGTYKLKGLPAGKYALRVSAGDGVHASMWWDGGDAQLVRGVTMSGRVADTAGNPIAGADVCLLWRPSGDGGCGATTADDGRYTWPFALDPDTYDLRVIINGKWYTAGSVRIPTNADEETRDITVDLAAAKAQAQLPETAQAAAPATTSIAVTEGQELTGKNLRLAARGKLAGATPTISGTARVGSTLTAKAGTWSPSPVKLSYRWYRSGASISGATKSTYTLTSADRGKKITVKVTGSKSGYVSVAKTSAATKTVASGTLKTSTPKISGTVKVGKKLTAKRGTWTSGVTFSYQWYRSGSKIKGATKSTYKLTSASKGKKITVKVTGSKSGYTKVTKTSSKTKSVAR